ncbi:Wadjet anti-phage system protein JetD domain-containing protein [Clostridium tunisiense]|uniref:Wadjet anti-phage system protein JetD domain-containing protein n=1 Tax=Clostridium tunisiense TaxID=219748 RepID=UPI0002F03966|nr:Wadjet anti-phage system protein JetD domain-containing protein [Clostridium tunisiense]
MGLIIIKSVYDIGKKIITISEIQEHFKIENYLSLVELIKTEVAKGTLSGHGKGKFNGMEPPLYNRYKIKPREEDLSHLEEEINYSFPLNFNREYYLKNLKKYENHRKYVEALIDYFRNKKSELQIPMSINERSFRIWGLEKFLKEGRGQSILHNVGLTINDLNVYATPEPFVYYSFRKNQNQIVLILENKDTWYTIRKLMIEGQHRFLGEAIDTIIYARGKNIEKSFDDYEATVEEYLFNPSKLLYWGDIDFEGIGIYERLKQRYSSTFKIELFRNAYISMVNLAEGRVLPPCSENQNKNIDVVFLKELEPYEHRILKLLEAGVYIPQEIVNYSELREE